MNRKSSKKMHGIMVYGFRFKYFTSEGNRGRRRGTGKGEGEGTGMGNGRKGVLRGNDKSRPVLCSAGKKGFQLKQKQGI